jgi:3-phenylpropionate/trans-cinnamate dioxygenase ferredoxin component
MSKEPSADFIAVASESELADPDSMLVEIDGRMIVLIHAAGHYYALDDLCTHDGGPLSGGRIDTVGAALVCPRHGARFELSSGTALTMPATKATVVHEVKVEHGKILVRLNKP